MGYAGQQPASSREAAALHSAAHGGPMRRRSGRRQAGVTATQVPVPSSPSAGWSSPTTARLFWCVRAGWGCQPSVPPAASCLVPSTAGAFLVLPFLPPWAPGQRVRAQRGRPPRARPPALQAALPGSIEGQVRRAGSSGAPSAGADGGRGPGGWGLVWVLFGELKRRHVQAAGMRRRACCNPCRR